MQIFNQKLKIPFSLIILIGFAGLSITLLWYYSKADIDIRWAPLVGGALVASISSLVHFGISFIDFRNNEKLNDSGVKKFLTRRDDKNYYKTLIESASKELSLLFYTSKRFCEDFCTDGDGDNLLIKCLNNNSELKVRLLVLSKNLIDECDKGNYTIAETSLKKMTDKFGERFEYRFYDHIPTHNIFMSDVDAVIGPYFYNKNSKYSHSIHFRADARYVQDYKTYFDAEWENAKSTD
jgi:hypothetical protein